ncbi:hypothetical protein [Faecalibacter rhinopitheci]|uniref:Uncharacterized protein n=1 Tax=Faecalibacter rhinopitheci TaxID=2779678 RepID=A0A8J7FS94_9FLAO|nr:hypothetical protein [Faecalibacter rhinopitheci]MBF0596667.1 hypothetical protein [Faecalibacter rhinopitheci]
MKKTIFAFSLLLSIVGFGQENSKGLIPSSGKVPVIKFTDEERKNKPSLQEFVETIYTNSVAVLEDGKSMYKEGEFPVYIFNRKSKSFKLIETKELNQYKLEQIKSFKYSKNAAETALFGSRIEATGLVYIEID